MPRDSLMRQQARMNVPEEKVENWTGLAGGRKMVRDAGFEPATPAV